MVIICRGEVRLKLDVQGQGVGKILDVDGQGGGVSWKLDNFHDVICVSSLTLCHKDVNKNYLKVT